MDVQGAGIDLNEVTAKVAEAKAFLGARQAMRQAVEDKFNKLMESLRDLRDAVNADIKASSDTQSDLETYFNRLQHKVESMPETPAVVGALEDIAYFGRVLVETHHNDLTSDMLDKAVGELDQATFDRWERSERTRLERIDAALMGLPSVK